MKAKVISFLVVCSLSALGDLPLLEQYEPTVDPQFMNHKVCVANDKHGRLNQPSDFRVVSRVLGSPTVGIVQTHSGEKVIAFVNSYTYDSPTEQFRKVMMGSYQYRWSRVYERKTTYTWRRVPVELHEGEQPISLAQPKVERAPILILVKDEEDNFRLILAAPNRLPYLGQRLWYGEVPLGYSFPNGVTPKKIVAQESSVQKFGDYRFDVIDTDGTKTELQITVKNLTYFLESQADAVFHSCVDMVAQNQARTSS